MHRPNINAHHARIKMQFGLHENPKTAFSPAVMDMTGWDARQHELDTTKNQAMYPVFQCTLQTNAIKAIVLKQETTGCSSRVKWGKLFWLHFFQMIFATF